MSRKLRRIVMIVSSAIGILVVLFTVSSLSLPQTPSITSLLVDTVPHLSNAMSQHHQFAEFEKKIEKYLAKWHINGASIAVAQKGQLIYAKGFGYADITNRLPVEAYHTFRVASVSKLITATAIMKLVEEGRLQFNTQVFGNEGVLNDSMFLQIKDPRVLQITVKHLLEHSAGWNTRYGDVPFMNKFIAEELGIAPPVRVDDVICFTLSKGLHFNVGTHSSYCNIGYVVLGRIIEQITNMPYEKFVQEAVLTPMGITNMYIGKSYSNQLDKNEVCYYDVEAARLVPAFDDFDTQVPRCDGGYNMSVLGAAGGWVASPASLLRFVACLDTANAVPNILPDSLISNMVRNDSGFDPLGWRMVTEHKYLRTGTLAGTSAVITHEIGGVTWAFVTNTSSWKGAEFSFYVEKFMNKLLTAQLPQWSTNVDLYKKQVYVDTLALYSSTL
ncbi:MAG: serine hydrolase domain-containing protein [Bacteroidales bacterium]